MVVQPSSASYGGPLLRSLAWSIVVVLVAGVLAVFTTPSSEGHTVVQQGVGPAVPAEQVGGAAPVEPGAATSARGPAATAAGAGPGATSPSATAAPASAKAKPAASTTATAKPVARAAAPSAAAGPKLQPAAGSYPLRISGTSSVDGKPSAVPSTGTLVVEQRGSDQQHRTVGVPGGLVLNQRGTADGVDVVSFSLSAGSRTLSFQPPAPVPFVRTNPGASWSWSARSTDGTVTVNQTATVSGGGSVNVGGTAVPTVTVQRVFNVSGAVQGTVRLTSSVSQADRLPVQQQQVIDVRATVLGLMSTSVASDTTITLTSTSPR